MKARRPIPRPASPGFTLVELMMVVVIISLLIAITIPLIGDLVTQSRRSATKTTITKLHEILQKRMDAFERGFPEYFRSVYGRDYQPANATDVMIRKTTFRNLFWLNGSSGVSNANATEVQSAAVLYKIVNELEFFGTAAEDAGQFNAAEIAEFNGNKVFVDSWGNPIVYYPYPTRLFKPDGTNLDPEKKYRYLFRSALPVNQLNEDPDDPFDVLTQTTPNFNETNFHTFKTHHTPLIVSAGPDGSFDPASGVVSGLGLLRRDTPNIGHLAAPDASKTEELYDNISNHNIKAGDQ